MKNLGGRPIEYTADIWPGILEKISSGASLSGALREPGMPSYVHAWRMLQADDKLKEAYQKAVEQRADRLVCCRHQQDRRSSLDRVSLGT